MPDSGGETNLNGALTFNYLLFDFGGRDAALEQARQSLLAADWTHNSTLQSVLLGAVQAYYQLYATQEAVAAVLAAEKASLNSLDATRARQRAGTATRADVLQAQTAYSQSQLNTTQANGDAATARGVLANTLGLSAEQPLTIAPPPDLEARQVAERAVSQLIEVARVRRPDLAAAQAQVRAAQSNIKVQESAGKPTLSLFAGLGATALAPGLDPNTGSIGLQLRIPLFTGYQSTYQILQARDQLEFQQATPRPSRHRRQPRRLARLPGSADPGPVAHHDRGAGGQRAGVLQRRARPLQGRGGNHHRPAQRPKRARERTTATHPGALPLEPREGHAGARHRRARPDADRRAHATAATARRNAMKRLTRHLVQLLVVAAVLGAAGGGWMWWQSRSKVPIGERYEFEEVGYGDVTQTVTANGTLNPVSLVNVGTQVSGTVKSLHADFNQEVKAGQLLLELDPTTLQATVEQTRGELASAEADLRLAKSDESRLHELFEPGVRVAPGNGQGGADARGSAGTGADRPREARSATVANLGYSRIRSPVSGVVVSRQVDLGQTVAASFQTPTLFQIARDLTQMQIDTSVAEADIGRITVGPDRRASPSMRSPVAASRARSSRCSLNPTNQQNVVTYDVVVSVSNPDLVLLPGMTAYVSFVIDRPRAAPCSCPTRRCASASTALTAAVASPARARPQPRDARPAHSAGDVRWASSVYVLRDNALASVPVQTGISDGHSTEVAGGELKAGDQVVVQDKLPASEPGGGRSNPSGCARSDACRSRKSSPARTRLRLVEVHALSKEYSTEAGVYPVLRDVSLRIDAGEFVCVMGPSGSGKSTFMNILGCLDVPTAANLPAGGARYFAAGPRTSSRRCATASSASCSRVTTCCRAPA